MHPLAILQDVCGLPGWPAVPIKGGRGHLAGLSPPGHTQRQGAKANGKWELAISLEVEGRRGTAKLEGAQWLGGSESTKASLSSCLWADKTGSRKVSAPRGPGHPAFSQMEQDC